MTGIYGEPVYASLARPEPGLLAAPKPSSKVIPFNVPSVDQSRYDWWLEASYQPDFSLSLMQIKYWPGNYDSQGIVTVTNHGPFMYFRVKGVPKQ